MVAGNSAWKAKLPASEAPLLKNKQALSQSLDTPGKRLLTVEEAAAYIGRTSNAMRHIIASGLVPIVRIGRKRIHIDKQDLDKLIEESKIRYE